MYIKNDKFQQNIKEKIRDSEPIDNILHVITVVSNPCNFKIRYKLCNEFIERIENEPNIILYVVELVYGEQDFKITDSENKRHLQLRGEIPLWHKENMINLAIKYLLPIDWKAVAWIDSDIEFDNLNWVTDTLKILNDNKDFIQLFSHAVDMNQNEEILNIQTGFAYQYCNNFKKGSGLNYWHPGYAWACNRKTYDKIGRLIEVAILGSADTIMASSFLNKANECLKEGMTEEYEKFIENYQKKFVGLKLGYISGTIKHYFHGKKENRKYYSREDILINNKFDPYKHLTRDSIGLLIPSNECPQKLIDDIKEYFNGRDEDEEIIETIVSKSKKNAKKKDRNDRSLDNCLVINYTTS